MPGFLVVLVACCGVIVNILCSLEEGWRLFRTFVWGITLASTGWAIASGFANTTPLVISERQYEILTVPTGEGLIYQISVTETGEVVNVQQTCQVIAPPFATLKITRTVRPLAYGIDWSTNLNPRQQTAYAIRPNGRPLQEKQ